MVSSRRRLIRIAVATTFGITITSVLGINLLNSRGSNSARQGLGITPSNEPRIIPDVPRDAIPPLTSPLYDDADKTPLRDQDFIVGYENDGDVRAYPIGIMNWHEIVNETIGGKRVLVTYCPLTYTGMVFDPQIDGLELTFGNTGALFESNLVMYDSETNSSWWQVGGMSIDGALKTSRMRLLPSITTTWRDWRKVHPDSLVLSRQTGFSRPYDQDHYAGYNTSGGPIFPVSVTDSRRDPKEIIIGLEVDGTGRAYPLEEMGFDVVIDEVNGKKLAIYSNPPERTGVIFDPVLGDRELDFRIATDGFVDNDTGSSWNIGGIATSGPLKGSKLRQIPALTGFWFAWSTLHPKSEIYSKS